MTSTCSSRRQRPTKVLPIALHVRSGRRWYANNCRPTQRELAFMVGVGIKLIRLAESRRRLPAPVKALYALSIALRTPMHALIDKAHRHEIALAVERRRPAIEARARARMARTRERRRRCRRYGR